MTEWLFRACIRQGGALPLPTPAAGAWRSTTWCALIAAQRHSLHRSGVPRSLRLCRQLHSRRCSCQAPLRTVRIRKRLRVRHQCRRHLRALIGVSSGARLVVSTSRQPPRRRRSRIAACRPRRASCRGWPSARTAPYPSPRSLAASISLATSWASCSAASMSSASASSWTGMTGEAESGSSCSACLTARKHRRCRIAGVKRVTRRSGQSPDPLRLSRGRTREPGARQRRPAVRRSPSGSHGCCAACATFPATRRGTHVALTFSADGVRWSLSKTA